MDRSGRRWLVRLVLGLVAAGGIAAPAPAAEQQQNGRDAPRPRGEGVDLFAAVAQQQIEVQLIPRDPSQCRLFISNKTDKPLSVKLPASFAGVPVLAQIPGLPGAGRQPGEFDGSRHRAERPAAGRRRRTRGPSSTSRPSPCGR